MTWNIDQSETPKLSMPHKSRWQASGQRPLFFGFSVVRGHCLKSHPGMQWLKKDFLAYFPQRPWCWERLKAEEEGDRGWDGWMASLTRWTWVWVKSRSWWWTGRPGLLQSMGLQRVGLNWVTKQQPSSRKINKICLWDLSTSFCAYPSPVIVLCLLLVIKLSC